MRARRARRAGASGLLRFAVASTLVLAFACAIRPKPEPPALDVGGVGTEPVFGDTVLTGRPGAARPPGAILRAWNLEIDQPPAETLVEADGSFRLELTLLEGQEVRLQVLTDEARSEPVDLIAAAIGSPPLPAVRALGDCLLLDPPKQIDTRDSVSVRVNNQCGFNVELRAPYVRRVLPGFDVGAGVGWPATLAPEAFLDVQVALPLTAGVSEEIFFIEATAPAVDRRPITAIAPR